MNLVELNYIPSCHQIADILTTTLLRRNFDEFNSKLGLYSIYNLAKGDCSFV